MEGKMVNFQRSFLFLIMYSSSSSSVRTMPLHPVDCKQRTPYSHFLPPAHPLRSGLLLLLLPQCRETHSGDLDNLESHSRNISLGLALTTETREEDFVVFVDKVETTIIGNESSDLLSVLDQLDTNTLSDGRVGLFGFDTDLLEDYTLGVGGSTEWRGLELRSEGTLLVGQIGPSLLAAMALELSGGVETTGLSFTHLEVLLDMGFVG